MDQFMIRTIGEDNMYKQAFLLMGYFREEKFKQEVFVKKFGLYLVVIRRMDGWWEMFFHFKDAQGNLQIWTSKKLDDCDKIDDICKDIAYSENFGFHTLHTGQLIGFD